MKEIGAFEAKNHLSELLATVAKTGEEILITNRGKPMAKLVPAVAKRDKANTLQELRAFAQAHPLVLKEGETIKSLIEEGRR